MNSIIKQKLLLKLLTIVFILLLASCAGEPTRQVESSDELGSKASSSNQPITKLDRDKYRNGITALNNDELSKAQRIFIEFIRNKPELAGGYSNLALVYFKMKDYEKSLKQVNKALQLNPEQAHALNLRAQIYIINGEIHKAKDDYLHAIKVKPKYVNAQYNLALLYDIYLQEIELAIKHYKLYMSLLKKPDEATIDWVKHLEGTLKDV